MRLFSTLAPLAGTLVLSSHAPAGPSAHPAADPTAQFTEGGARASSVARKASEGPLAPLLDSLLLRELGPTNMGGRIMDFAVYERDPRIFYVATASGGLYKTTNGGTSFTPLFQQEGSISLGAVAIAPSNPDVVYVGTGEQSSRNSVAWGDGVYRSTDGGKTFVKLGLTETRHIGRIVVDPRNPDVAYVAALGRLWGRSEERGVYKTTDGGKTWAHVLALDEKSGAVDLDMDPKDPNVLYASMWDRLRKPYVFASGGPTSGLYKTSDGGRTWKRLGKGLPGGDLGRIGVSIYRKDPRVLVATVEYAVPGAPKTISSDDDLERSERERDAGRDSSGHEGAGGETGGLSALRLLTSRFQGTSTTPPQTGGQTGGQKTLPPQNTGKPKTSDEPKRVDPAATTGQKSSPAAPKAPAKPKDPRMVVPSGSQFNGGGLFLSRDGGESWTLLRQLDPRPFYFSTPLIDPNDARRIYMGGLNILMTTDGGKTWKTVGDVTHADHHAIWVDPRDSNTVMTGCDGGVNISRDRALTWDVIQSMPIGQFYSVDYDTQRPYWVYGGLQDNGTWGIPTQSPNGGVGFWDAQSLYGGDGFYTRTDKANPAIVYAESQGGNVGRINRTTGERKSLRPAMNKAAGLAKTAKGKTEELRCNWNTPIELGRHAEGTVYVGAHRLLRSTDRGETFAAISPDLTGNSPRKEATELIAARISVNGEATGAENHCTIVTIAESPVTKGVIATGSDDGRVNVTKDDGKTWTDVTRNLPGLPDGIWCTRVILSKWKSGRMYATFDNHRYDDFKPYLYRSEDLGATWTRMDGGLPDYDCLYVIREDERNPRALYLGSEMSLRVSNDEGATWTRLRSGFPTVAVHDLQVNDRDSDLVIGTHGRAIWTLDIGPISNLSAGDDGKADALFPPKAIVRMPFTTSGGWEGNRYFVARNTQPGTTVYYRLAAEPKSDVVVRLLGADGKSLTSVDGTKRVGMNAVRIVPRANGQALPAGKYTVELGYDGKKTSQPVEIFDPKGY